MFLPKATRRLNENSGKKEETHENIGEKQHLNKSGSRETRSFNEICDEAPNNNDAHWTFEPCQSEGSWAGIRKNQRFNEIELLIMPTALPQTTLKKGQNRSDADHKTMRVHTNREGSDKEMKSSQSLDAAALFTYTKSCDDYHNDEM